ncbi:MAG: sugar phosphate nucleotidyltransferase [Candidatus Curtissbacteria bacterium]
MKSKNNFAAIILAGGLGKRMKSKTPKVLQELGGRPMISYTIDTLFMLKIPKIITVTNPKNSLQVKKLFGPRSDYALQATPRGTGDAARAGLALVPQTVSTVAVMYGDDSAFYKPQTIEKVALLHEKSNAKITFVTLTRQNPAGLGRIVRKNGKLLGIVEEKDASPQLRQIKEVNDGLYFFDKTWLAQNLKKLSPSPVTGEYYLTDLIDIALSSGQIVKTHLLEDSAEWHGINTPEQLQEANIKLTRKIHIMGIAGAGAAAVAGIAAAYGFDVSGCDKSPASAYSRGLNVKIENGHSPNHLKGIDMLVLSPAITKLDPKNPEVQYAKQLKLPILTWQQFQAEFLQRDKFIIAVAGAYGKSTTTAMISQILIGAGLDPTCEVGAKVLAWNKNFKVGKSKYFVCEADEYNNNFLNYNPDIAVILNIAWEHPDFFKSEKDVESSYQKFADNIKPGGSLIISSGIKSITPRKDINVFKINNPRNIRLSIIGDFRKENAAAALAVAKALEVDNTKARKSIKGFGGLGRRLELKGEIKGVKFYDDYAVQPYTAKTTANALKEKFKDKKVLLVFEPHTFSRVETFFDDFVSSLAKTNVNQIYITEVFAAREHGDKIVLAQKLAQEVGGKAVFTGSLHQTAEVIKKNMDNFDIILSMGAGDVYKLFDILKS